MAWRGVPILSRLRHPRKPSRGACISGQEKRGQARPGQSCQAVTPSVVSCHLPGSGTEATGPICSLQGGACLCNSGNNSEMSPFNP